MSAYMSAVLACAAVTALTAILMPDDETTSRYIKYISGLVSLSVIVTPVLSALRTPVRFPEISDDVTFGSEYSYDMDETVISEAERTLAAAVKNDLRALLGIDSDELDVSVTLSREDRENIRILSVTVTLTGYGAWADTNRIVRYIKENYDKNTEVEIRYE